VEDVDVFGRNRGRQTRTSHKIRPSAVAQKIPTQGSPLPIAITVNANEDEMMMMIETAV
jgi:hypothetical protein